MLNSFYGPIESKFDGVFKRTVSELENVHYMGIFKGSDEEKYKELRKYDVLLLPTRWKNEGVPGILVGAQNRRIGRNCEQSKL